MSAPAFHLRQFAVAFHLNVPRIAALTPYFSIICWQIACYQYFASQITSNSMILKIGWRGEGYPLVYAPSQNWKQP
jgi:hypothetical protein